MVHNHGPEKSHEHRQHQQMQLVYAKQTKEKEVFMHDLAHYRKLKEKRVLKALKYLIGPTWYQVLSVGQRAALDTLAPAIYKDNLEQRPIRTGQVMARLGLVPRPTFSELMQCNDVGRDDPKEMLAHLFYLTYGFAISGRKERYSLKAKLILSGILYLGLKDLIIFLTEKFKPDEDPPPPPKGPKPKKDPPLESPYLQKVIAPCWFPCFPKRPPPLPLPSNLDDLNEPYVEPPPLPKPVPKPPPPPPPPKKIPVAYCEKLAGIMRIEPADTLTSMELKSYTQVSQRKKRGVCVEVKKTYGIGISTTKKSTKLKKIKAPTTNIWNAQYTINGVFTVNGKRVFVLGQVSILPPLGDLIHGGYSRVNGENINIHCGYRGLAPPPAPDPCDCVKTWQQSVFAYIKSTKCYHRHDYDYYNEGSFGPEELPYFEKPTKLGKHKFNYDTIFDLDEKSLLIKKEFKRVWDTESALRVSDGNAVDKKKKKKKRSSRTCLGETPKPEDYLRCALRQAARSNVAARLPDAHRVPELREWMRRRIYGPLTQRQKDKLKLRSVGFWQTLKTLSMKGVDHVFPKRDSRFIGHTTWKNKQTLNDQYRKYTEDYRLALFRAQANIANNLWPTMFQAEMRNKKFREIYFSYIAARVEDLQLMRPYNAVEVQERKMLMLKQRYYCRPDGVEPDD